MSAVLSSLLAPTLPDFLEPTGKIALQTCKHISLALIGLLTPCALTVALQAIQTALASINALVFYSPP